MPTFREPLVDAGRAGVWESQVNHSDPGFTLRTYTHLMPTTNDRMRLAVDGAWRVIDKGSALDVPSQE